MEDKVVGETWARLKDGVYFQEASIIIALIRKLVEERRIKFGRKNNAGRKHR